MEGGEHWGGDGVIYKERDLLVERGTGKTSKTSERKN